ncbi:hypothetical protein BB560_000551, partial [Smittium megazygosporum]
MYIERCPLCNKNTPETIKHMLIECLRWNAIRHETTIFNIPRLYRTVTIDESTNNQALNQGRNIMVGKLLGGGSLKKSGRYLPYMKDLETGRFMNGIRVVRTLILDRIKCPPTPLNQCPVDRNKLKSSLCARSSALLRIDAGSDSLSAGQTENAEYQGTKPDQSPHPTATRLVLPSSSSKGSLHG